MDKQKEINIDGVNVIGCKYYEENYGEYHQGHWENNDVCHNFTNHCSDNKSCYYKQLRTAQEQNKIMLEALELIATKNPVYICWSMENVIGDCCKGCDENKDGCTMNPKYLAEQAIKQITNNTKEIKQCL